MKVKKEKKELEKVDKPEEADNVQKMVEMIKSGETVVESPSRLEDMTLTEVAAGIEKINAIKPMMEAAQNEVKDEHYKELGKLEIEHKNILEELIISQKRKVDSIVDKHAVENNTCKKFCAEVEERKESLLTKLQALLPPPGHSAKPPPPS